jgi:hypothetical protein
MPEAVDLNDRVDSEVLIALADAERATFALETQFQRLVPGVCARVSEVVVEMVTNKA